jgi:dihydroorotate dehydrogenase (fumarate)
MTVDLRTRYLGLELRSPIVASAAPQNGEPAMAGRLEAAGVGAIVLPSLFEEEILAEELGLNRSLEQGTEHFAEALDYFPAVDRFIGAGDRYLASLERVKAQATVPIVGSLNATSVGGWIRYARLIEDAGADALELNLYHLVADPLRRATDLEAADLELIAAVRASCRLPLAIKVSPYYSAFAHFAGAAVGAGADGLVLFNRFYQPDIDLDTLDVVPRLELSQPMEIRLPARWIAILRPQLGPGVSLAASSGAHTGTDVVKGLMVGADVVMMTSALLRSGPEHVAATEAELRAWMTEHEYESVDQLRGSASRATAENPSAFERANYMQMLRSWVAPRELTPTSPQRLAARHGDGAESRSQEDLPC